jgi:colanic acid biosynthesis glycosyl transferase WcaI
MTDLAIELRRLGHSVTVLTTTPHYNIDQAALARQPMQRRWGGLVYYSECDRIPVWHVTLPMKGKRVWKRGLDFLRFHLMSLLISLLTLGPQDIVIATSPPLTIGVVSWLLGVRWHTPSIYKVAELYPDLAIRQGLVRHPALIAALRWLERFVYARNTKIVTIAEHFKKVILECGVPDKKLMVIRDSVDVELYRPLPRDNSFAMEQELLEGFVVLYAGNIGLVQDWDSVLYAASVLSNYPIQFVIVGDGARRDWLTQQVKIRNLQNIKLIGYQPKEMMPQVNASCDLAIIPMTRAGALDGLPSKIYTIMASGKPVIATAELDSDMAWLIQQAQCGRVVAPENPQAFAEAIEVAYHDRDSLPAEGERGRIFVEAFTKELMARRINDLICTLVKK